MLRRDPAAWFEKSGAWIFSRYRFVSGEIEAQRSLDRAGFRRLAVLQQDAPVPVLVDRARRRTWWWFRDEFYWEDEGLQAGEVLALAVERAVTSRRRLRRAMALLDQESEAPADRAALPARVRELVWQRDRGRCASCGSKQRLEFDHVIPVALGGSSTARNLQLLCERCNRAKGASLA
jgi:hypothetical protein